MKNRRSETKSGRRVERSEKKGFRVDRVVRIGLALFLPLFALALIRVNPAGAAEDPEDLYRRGRFSEAEKGFAELDMDHPRDVRYRYNRGCAAYHNSDYQGARSAFSSVLSRSEDREVRLRAAYNLGNAAYKQGDYKSAADYYRQAVSLEPSFGEAKYNLELALRALEKQQKEQEKSKSPGGEGKDGGKEESQDSEKEGKPGDNASKEPEPKKSDAQEPQNRETGESMGEQGDDLREQEKDGADEKRSAEQESPEDLSGELKPLRDHANRKDEGEEGKTAEALSGIDRKRAEALLDNIQEDRSRYLRFLVPEDKKQGVVSGKDW